MSVSKYIGDLGFDTHQVSQSAVGDESLLEEQTFQRMISCERKRSERSRKSLLLMIVDLGVRNRGDRDSRILHRMISALATATRETDVKGWYKSGSAVGVIFTEIGDADKSTIVATMLTRISETLRNVLPVEHFNRINVSFHAFPQEWDHQIADNETNPTLYPDIVKRTESKKLFRVVKRVIDIVGSIATLLLCIPVIAVIVAAIKVTSKGPVLFRQTRIGQYGVPFTFIKFRSMKVNNDAQVHKQYVRRLIAGKVHDDAGDGSGKVYKLTQDSRITMIGRILRKTSLDELPQLFNVLKGEMSLVGPRPPIEYEVEAYDFWHRSRLLEVKPGMTGLWQVNGRSRVDFNQMVRLDLRYAKNWSPWLDIKILLRTPAAVFNGIGSY